MAEVTADYDNNTVPPQPSRRHDDNEYNNSSLNEDDQLSPRQPPQNEEEAEQPLSENGNERRNLSRTESIESSSSRPREATELDEMRRVSSESTSEGSLSSGEYRVITPRHSGATTTTTRSNNTTESGRRKKRFQAIRRFWARNVTLEVPQKGNRDYFALERTFLAYMRTSATFSMQGVLVAQLFRLQTSSSQPSGSPLSRINFHSVGVPLGVTYQVCAIMVALMGAHRFWRQQHAIAREKVLAGGWELHSIGIMTFLAGVGLLALAIVIIAESA